MSFDDQAPAPVAGFSVARRLLHWLTVLLLVGSFLLVWSIEWLPEGALRPQALGIHRTIGLVVLALSAGRILWSLVSARPSAFGAARGVQAALLACLLLVPLLGWAYTNARGHVVSLWGMPLPSLIFKDQYFSRVSRESHEFLAYALLVLITAHVGAALWHHLVLRDGTLRRMWRS